MIPADNDPNRRRRPTGEPSGLGRAALAAATGWTPGQQPRNPPALSAAQPSKPEEPWRPLAKGENGDFVAGPEQDAEHAKWSQGLQAFAREQGIDAQWQPTAGAGGGYFQGVAATPEDTERWRRITVDYDAKRTER